MGFAQSKKIEKIEKMALIFNYPMSFPAKILDLSLIKT